MLTTLSAIFLACLLAMAIPLAAGLPANLAAPYIWIIASVILPVAVDLALSSDSFNITPNIRIKFDRELTYINS